MENTKIDIGEPLKTWKDVKVTKHIQYRGILNSCNYSCAYCPFSKKPHQLKAEEKDKECLKRLFYQLKEVNKPFTFQIVPYGEALIHSYYWKFLAKLSKLPQVRAIGSQTNASFPVEKMLSIYHQHGGIIDKLRLWCTFHPTMISVENFIHQIKLMKQYHILLCVGAVADPLQKETISQIRSLLPKETYFWLNQMDGRTKDYTTEDRHFFQTIDPLFFLEETQIPFKNCSFCAKRNLFVKANGDCFPCNISKIKLGNIYKDYHKDYTEIGKNILSTEYSHKENHNKHNLHNCSCFLAYQNRIDILPELTLFFPYPAFRIIENYQERMEVDNL